MREKEEHYQNNPTDENEETLENDQEYKEFQEEK